MSQDNKQGGQPMISTPKSQIKLTQIINNTGAVAAVPYYSRKLANNGGPTEISS
jgi:hypothetical protein